MAKSARINTADIAQHVNNNEVCYISVCRHDNTTEQNDKLTRELESNVRVLGYRFLPIIGTYTKDQGTENEMDVREKSLVVINPAGDRYSHEFAKEMLYLCGKYRQPCILLKADGFPPAWYDKDGQRKSEILSEISIHDLEQGFGKIHGKQFSVIESGEFFANEMKSHKNLSSWVAEHFLRKAMAQGIYNWEDVPKKGKQQC